MKTQTKYLHYKIGEHYQDGIIYTLASRVDESDGHIFIKTIDVPVITADRDAINKARIAEFDAQIIKIENQKADFIEAGEIA